MKYNFFDVLELIGSLGMFLYGMKVMSESLQKLAGSKLQSVLSLMTSNRLLGVITGLVVTMIIQSSSATTVMVVSFANAGLMNLIQSIGVIMGANIGTTATAWIISLLGIKFSMEAIALPLVGISLFFIFSKNMSRKFIGEFIIGFALLFYGLGLLKHHMPNIHENPEMLEFVKNYTHWGFGSVLVFLGLGTVLTLIIQSSSATMALTLLMCNNGWIPFELGAAMVLGENIGTTVTANLAAAVGNIHAKRAALAHLMFNVFGVIWILTIFYHFVGTLDSILGPNTDVTIKLSLFHTSFNVLNVCILFFFAPLIEKTVIRLIPTKANDKEDEFRLQYISTGMLSTTELSLLQSRKEVVVFSTRILKMFHLVRDLYEHEDEKTFSKRFARIKKYEEITDRLEEEIATYVSDLSVNELSKESSNEIRAQLKTVNELESIGDCCFNLARILERKREFHVTFTDGVVENLHIIFNLVEKALEQMNANISMDNYHHLDITVTQNIENEINIFRTQLISDNVENVKMKIYKYKEGIVYTDAITECEKIGDFAMNIAKALKEIQHTDDRKKDWRLI